METSARRAIPDEFRPRFDLCPRQLGVYERGLYASRLEALQRVKERAASELRDIDLIVDTQYTTMMFVPAKSHTSSQTSWDPSVAGHRGQVVLEVPDITPGDGELQTGWYCTNCQSRCNESLDVAGIQSDRKDQEYELEEQEFTKAERKAKWTRHYLQHDRGDDGSDGALSDDGSVISEDLERFERRILGDRSVDERPVEEKNQRSENDAQGCVHDAIDRCDIAYESQELKSHMETCNQWWDSFEAFLKSSKQEMELRGRSIMLCPKSATLITMIC